MPSLFSVYYSMFKLETSLRVCSFTPQLSNGCLLSSLYITPCLNPRHPSGAYFHSSTCSVCLISSLYITPCLNPRHTPGCVPSLLNFATDAFSLLCILLHVHFHSNCHLALYTLLTYIAIFILLTPSLFSQSHYIINIWLYYSIFVLIKIAISLCIPFSV